MRPLVRRWWPPALFFLVLAATPLWLHDGYLLQLIFRVVVFAVLGMAWNILGGYAGQLSLGHVIREVPNKKAHSHYVHLLGGWGMDTPTTNATILSREALLKVRAFALGLKRTLVRRSPPYGLLQTLGERQLARNRLVQCSVCSWNSCFGRHAHVIRP